MIMSIKERVKSMCSEKGITINKLEKMLGFGTGYISKMDKGASNSVYVQKIADFFEVSTDYILKGEDALNDAPSFKEEHFQLISMYECLSDEQKNAIITIMSGMIK